MGAVRMSCPTGRNGQEQGSAGFRVGTPSLPEPGLPEPGTSSPIARGGRGGGGHHVLPQSIRQAMSLRNPTFAYEHIQANADPRGDTK